MKRCPGNIISDVVNAIVEGERLMGMGKARTAAECRREIARLEQIDLDAFTGPERRKISRALRHTRRRLEILKARRRRG